MHFESFYPFLLVVAPFGVAFFSEAMVIYLFRLKPFWAAFGVAILINVLSLVILYGSSLLVAKLGYQFGGLLLPVQVVVLFWWLSIITDGLLLKVFTPAAGFHRLFSCSIVMNTLSWIFLYFLILNSK